MVDCRAQRDYNRNMAVNYLEIPHFDLSPFAYTQTSSEVASGATTLPVESVSGFSSTKFALVGILGSEKAEKGYINAAPVSPNIVVASGLTKSHRKGAPVTLMPYDQIEIYRATGETEPSDDDFDTLLDTINADLEQVITLYEDSSAPANAWYKVKYKNSATGDLSSFRSGTLQTSTDILYASPAEVMCDLGIGKDAFVIREIIESICDLIDAECQRGGRLYNRTVTEVHDMEKNRYKYFVSNTPLVAITKLEYKDGTGAWKTDTRNKYAYDQHVEFDYPYLADRRQALRFTLTVGQFESDQIPKMLNMYVRRLARQAYQEVKTKYRQDIKKKKIGDYEVQYADNVDLDVYKSQIEDSQVAKHFGLDVVFGMAEGKFRRASELDNVYAYPPS